MIKCLLGALSVFFLVAATACGDGSNGGSQGLPIADPTIETAPDIGVIVLQGTSFPLDEVNYREREFFLSGDATAFVNLSELGPDGHWDIEPGETAQYKTRVVVYRPIDGNDFSGTVIVEWLNVSAGLDSAPVWKTGHTEIIREGHAWVGVSAQLVGIEGSAAALAPLYLKAANPERYADLQHPGDSFSYDIFSQVAQAVRRPGEMDILEGLQARHILGVGESQSAMRLVTYINAVHPLYKPYQGYMVHSRGGFGIPLAEPPQETVAVPPSTLIRTDLDVPVFNFQTETDLFSLAGLSIRQDDSDSFHLWEAAGTAHADYYLTISGGADTGTDPAFALVVEENSVGGFINCDSALNAGPLPWLFNAALNALERWVSEGIPPPEAERLRLNDDSSEFVLDEFGNALGGVRSPYLEAPAARLSGLGQSGAGFCLLFGTTDLFDAARMSGLYVDRDGYNRAVAAAADEAVAGSFLLPPDADRIKAAAGLQWDMLGM